MSIEPKWAEMAQHIVHRSLRLRPLERVLYLTDPYLYPELLEGVRLEVQRARAIDVAAMLTWSPQVASLRGQLSNQRPDELEARRQLFEAADVLILLPRDEFVNGSATAAETEMILESWSGRAVHFHWASDEGSPQTSAIHRAMWPVYERGILDLDYDLHAAQQRRLIAAIRGTDIRMTSASGTDLRFKLPADGWYHAGDGNASLESVASAGSARDRMQELPCGNVRTIPAPDSVEGILSLRGDWKSISSTLDFNPFIDNLDFVFRAGRVTEVRSGTQPAELTRAWATQTGDKDRLSEVMIGTNPLLTTPLGARIPIYWGSGAGAIRLRLGTNREAGGTFRSSLSANFFLTDATLEANGERVLESGRLLV
jgi:leucyl aminopeptidase (aminopeptidase T)